MAFQKNTIAQRIGLEGGKAIEDQLKALGDAGEKAFNQIKNAAIKADLDKFSASLSKVGNDLAAVVRRVALLPLPASHRIDRIFK
ncbi:hypothetical protein [Mesorhizobium amorphae]|uniref:hypothetical protein n=1 Tax=Mesorhizobium amorphae TaxID=71433 RepID=UPI00178022F9|nr:hypothetical protein [Mesorhizobium amorphae]